MLPNGSNFDPQFSFRERVLATGGAQFGGRMGGLLGGGLFGKAGEESQLFRRPDQPVQRQIDRPQLPLTGLATEEFSILSALSGFGEGSGEFVAPPEVALAPGRLTGPVQFFGRLLKDWRLGLDEACMLLGFEAIDRTHLKSVLAGKSSLQGRDVKDRIVFLMQIREGLDVLFRNLDVENEWLRESQPELENRSPMETMLEGSMVSMLVVKEFVDIVTGR